jgi:hypothetical protein
MLIALLVVLGVNLWVVLAFISIVRRRRKWLKTLPGQFFGAVRVTSGELEKMPKKWRRGSARWVRDVLVWFEAPFMFRTRTVPVDRLSGEREAADGEVKRLGDDPVVATFVAGDATFELAAKAEQQAMLSGPFAEASSPERAGGGRNG